MVELKSLLPTEKRKPSKTLFDYTIMIYGNKFVGKSTLLAQIPNNLFLNTGGGLGTIECYEKPITSWEEFIDVGFEIVQGKHNFKCITVDTIDRLAKYCQNYMMEKLNVVHPADLGFGKGWDMIKDEFIRPFMKLALSPYGLVIVSHAKDVEITTRTSKITKFVPSMQDFMYNIIAPVCDIILYYDIVETAEGMKRYIRTVPTENWEAGDRSGRLSRYEKIEMLAPPAENWNKVQEMFDKEIKS